MSVKFSLKKFSETLNVVQYFFFMGNVILVYALQSMLYLIKYSTIILHFLIWPENRLQFQTMVIK